MTSAPTFFRSAAGATLLSLASAGAIDAAPAIATPAKPKAPASPAPPAASTGKGMQWVDSYDVAIARAKKERKHVLLDFYTDWCGWCKRLDSDVFAKDSFLQAADGVLAVKINAEKLPQLAQRYQVTSYPRLFVLNADGVTVERIRGYLSLQDFTAKIQQVKAGDTEYRRLRDAAMDPTNLGAIHRFARYLSEDRQHEPAIQYWQQVHDLALQQLFQSPGAPAPMASHREALVELARGYSAVGLDEVARQHFDEVLRVYSDDPRSAGMALVGMAQLEMKKPGGRAKADQYLDRVMREYPGTPAMAEAAAMKRSMSTVATTAAPK